MKYLKWLVILLLFVAVASSLYLLVPHKVKTPTGASLLPADTFLFLQIPDVPNAKRELRTTALWQIWSEKEVQDFVNKTADAIRTGYREKVGDNVYVNLLRRAVDLANGEMFVAVPVLGAIQKEISVVVMGVDVKGRKAEADRWIEELKAKLKTEFAQFKEETTEYRGITYQSWAMGSGKILHTYFGTMLVVTTKPESMEAIIDRVRDSASPTLDKDERYLRAMQRMSTRHSLFVYGNPRPLLGMLRVFALTSSDLLASLRKAEAIQAVSYSTTIVGGSFQDVFFVDAPAEKRGDMGDEHVPTTRKTLPLTEENALVYFVQSVNLSNSWETMFQQFQSMPVPKLREFMFTLDKFSRENGIDPKDFIDNVGPEYAFSLSWPTNAPIPEMFLALEVRDRAKASAALDKLWQWGKASTKATGMDPFTDIAYGGTTIHALQTRVVAPSYAVTEKFVLLSLQTNTMKQLIERPVAAGKSLADNPTYQKTMGSLPPGGYSYSYLDTSNLFTRTYSFIQPLAKQYGGSTSAVQDYVDFNKLPQAATIAKHLHASASSQVVDKDGFTTVIISPVGMPVVTVGALVGAGVAIAQNFPGFPMK